MASKKKAQFDAIFADETADLSPFALLGIEKGRGSDVTVDRKPRVTVDRKPQPSDVTSEGRPSPVTSDSQTQPAPIVFPIKAPSPEPKSSLPMSDGQTQPVRHNHPESGIPLAPIQWSVWQYLKDNLGQVFNYQALSEQLHIKPRSIKQAVQVLKTVGLVADQTIVRTRTTQGFSVSINENCERDSGFCAAQPRIGCRCDSSASAKRQANGGL